MQSEARSERVLRLTRGMDAEASKGKEEEEVCEERGDDEGEKKRR